MVVLKLYLYMIMLGISCVLEPNLHVFSVLYLGFSM